MWPKHAYRWVDNGRVHYSVPFTWCLGEVLQEILEGDQFHDTKPLVGGPAVRLMPHILSDVAEIGGDMPGVLQRVNPQATKTTEGCPNKCGFCAVPIIEPEYRELSEWPRLPIVCDNNLLAASMAHFDRVIDSLKGLKGVDFNQGLDARLMTDYHARRLAELDCTVRLAWDHVDNERHLMKTLSKLRKAGIKKENMRCYVLIGFNDTPEDALYRLETLWWSIGIIPNPMRYTPINSTCREYVGPSWSENELTRYMRYWDNLRYTAGTPFEEFTNNTKLIKHRKAKLKGQLTLDGAA